jgi:hypothetical protein
VLNGRLKDLLSGGLFNGGKYSLSTALSVNLKEQP